MASFLWRWARTTLMFVLAAVVVLGGFVLLWYAVVVAWTYHLALGLAVLILLLGVVMGLIVEIS